MDKSSVNAEFTRVGRDLMKSAADVVTAIFEKYFSEAMANAMAEVQEMLGAPAPKHATRKVVTEAKSGWPDDPQERSREMKRRMAVAKANKAKHPREPGHPDHAQWAAKMKKARKRTWDKKSPAERQAVVEAMMAGKRKKKRGVAKLERVA